jgi:hypothetical protein
MEDKVDSLDITLFNDWRCIGGCNEEPDIEEITELVYHIVLGVGLSYDSVMLVTRLTRGRRVAETGDDISLHVMSDNGFIVVP